MYYLQPKIQSKKTFSFKNLLGFNIEEDDFNNSKNKLFN
jgi:hypothetical protein